MKLLGSTKSKITNDKNGEHVAHLEMVELVLVIVIVLIIIINKIREYYIHSPQINPLVVYYKYHPPNHIFLKIFNSKFQEMKVWFTEEASKPLEVKDKVNLTLIIK